MASKFDLFFKKKDLFQQNIPDIEEKGKKNDDEKETRKAMMRQRHKTYASMTTLILIKD